MAPILHWWTGGDNHTMTHTTTDRARHITQAAIEKAAKLTRADLCYILGLARDYNADALAGHTQIAIHQEQPALARAYTMALCHRLRIQGQRQDAA